ncbi:amino acid permease [Boletus edulis BED1]|uniref:Amino acid permease n=1 Tax=Boletus edulis BED1 TaxID=1328754 RepID=A0AAD4BJP2_BOLED|nr:amino acid permease [Boletus edulis BED1]
MASDEGSNEKKVAHDADAKSLEGQTAFPEVHTTLHRKLKNRHVAMISIGGVIGTGLFLGTATSLMNGGPIGILLGYIFIGTICFATMLSLGEMTAFLPLPGGFIKLAERFIDPAYAFATGWNYWYGWTLTLPAELSAAAAVISYWDKSTSPAVWITMCLIVAIGINALGVGAYGEAEFWFSSIKVITITGMIILGIIVDLGGGPKHDRIGFRYWKNPGPFTDYHGFTGPKGHFLGTCSVATQAAFSYLGTEAVAMAAAEARNPRRNIPKAIRRVYFRVLVFYIGGVLIIGLLVPSNNSFLNLDSSNASASPFVIAFNEAGIKILPSIINAAILTSAWSASSSDLYLASRSLYGLSVSGSAPKIFSRTTRSGMPFVAVGTCSCFAFLAYMTLGNSSGIVFTWLSNFTATAGLVTWFGIGVTYLRFYKGMKAQGIDRKKLPFAPRFQPYAGWWCVCGSAFVLFFSAWEVFLKGNWSTATFLTDYLPIMLFPLLYLSAKLVMRVRTIRPDEMDFVSDVAEFDAMTYDDPPPKNKMEAVWAWLM